MKPAPSTKPRLALIDGVALVTSLTVAEAFGKPHDRVIQIIGDLLGKMAAKTLSGKAWGNLHFRACDSAGPPMYRITRDGFVKLVRCFAGRKAAVRNLYLAAFDAVEGRTKPEVDVQPPPAKTNMPVLAVSQQPRVFAGALQGCPALLVDARELHASLAVGREFANWIREKIVDYGYVADQDYVKVLPAPPVPRGRQALAFHLGLEMAKDLTAIVGSTKAKMVKRYLQRYDRHLQTLDVLGMSAYPHGGGKVEQAWDSKEGRLVDLRTGVPVGGELAERRKPSAAPTQESANSPMVFQFESFSVRTIDRDGEIWFVGSDVAKALDYADSAQFTRWLDDDEKGLHNVQTPGGIQNLPIINESGLYSAILRSRKAEAKKFKKWVTSEVLPTIRKTGRYEAPQQAAKPAPDTSPANLLPGLNVGEEDFFLAAYNALGRENGMTTLLVQLVKMGAFNQWINASVRDVAEASGGKISKTNVQYNTKRLVVQGLIERKSSQYYVFGEALRERIELLKDEGVLLALPGEDDSVTVH